MTRRTSGICVVVFGLFLQSCDSMLCGYSDKIEYPSPGGEFIASVYEYDCGATTSDATRINLRPRWSLLNPRFNPRSGVVFLVNYRPVIRIQWKTNQELEVE